VDLAPGAFNLVLYSTKPSTHIPLRIPFCNRLTIGANVRAEPRAWVRPRRFRCRPLRGLFYNACAGPGVRARTTTKECRHGARKSRLCGLDWSGLGK
jgi:hypothetical protein